MAGAQTTSTASISGTAVDQSGASTIASVTIISGASVSSKLTGADGKFQFSQLRAGTYLVCGQAAPLFVNPEADNGDRPFNSCEWMNSSAPGITVAAGQSRTGVTVPLKRGRLFSIRVNDPGKVLPSAASQYSGNELSLRISGPDGVVHRIRLSEQDTSGRTYGIVIAYSTPHKLWIQSSKLAVTSAPGGSPFAGISVGTISPTSAVNVQVSPGDPVSQIVLNVAGIVK